MVTLNDKANRTIAKIAHAIEDNNMLWDNLFLMELEMVIKKGGVC
ncbi:hypothetical protein [Shewanella japonica]|nr:hypothetical protein [Shewanella japonica]